jgi:hypothetical protein
MVFHFKISFSQVYLWLNVCLIKNKASIKLLQCFGKNAFLEIKYTQGIDRTSEVRLYAYQMFKLLVFGLAIQLVSHHANEQSVNVEFLELVAF